LLNVGSGDVGTLFPGYLSPTVDYRLEQAAQTTVSGFHVRIWIVLAAAANHNFVCFAVERGIGMAI
jgi:hypothetical protein